MLAAKRRASLERAGRALSALQVKVPNVAVPILRSVVSSYVRAPSFVPDLKRDGDRLPDLADALNDAFEDAPEQVDALLQEYADNAPLDQRIRIYKIYAFGLYVRHDAPPVPSDSRRHSIALKRLVWAPTIEHDDQALSELSSAFRPGSDRLTAVIRDQLDAVLGAILLMADRLAELDAAKPAPNDTVLAAMERRTRRVTMRGIMESYVEWASAAAVGDAASIGKIVGLFDQIPEGRDELVGTLLSATKELAGDFAGLNGLLPHLYKALVGPSVLVRSYAATAVGDLPYRSIANIPDLVFEAFCTLLWDQYVAVHKTAVQAFRRSVVPEALRPRAADALMNLIRAYRVESGEDDFLADCVQLAAGMTDLFGERSQEVRRYLIEVAMGIEPLYLQNEISSLSYTLGEEPAFAKLLARVLPDFADRDNGSDSAQELLRRLPAESSRLHAAELSEAALAVLEEDFVLALVVVEILVDADAGEEALKLCGALKARLGDTTRTYSRRAALEWPELAIRFERAVAEGDSGRLAAIASEWAKAAAEFETHREDGRERRSRSSLPF